LAAQAATCLIQRCARRVGRRNRRALEAGHHRRHVRRSRRRPGGRRRQDAGAQDAIGRPQTHGVLHLGSRSTGSDDSDGNRVRVRRTAQKPGHRVRFRVAAAFWMRRSGSRAADFVIDFPMGRPPHERIMRRRGGSARPNRPARYNDVNRNPTRWSKSIGSCAT
jgi:hypothetical protein